MTEYRLDPDALGSLMRRRLLVTIPMFAAIVGAVIWFNPLPDPTTLIPLIVIASVALAWGTRNATRLQREGWNSFRIELDDDRLTRTQTGLPTLTIERKDVTGIIENPASLRVQSPQATIFIRRELLNYDQLRQTLEQWMPIEPQTTPTSLVALAQYGMTALFIVGLGVIYYVEDPRIALPTALLMLPAYVISIYVLWRSPHVDQKLKRHFWLHFLPLLAIVAKIVTLLAPLR